MGDARVPVTHVFICGDWNEAQLMGYGNSLFDGDEPLPPANQKQRGSMGTGLKSVPIRLRVWLGAALAGAAGEGSGLPDRHHDQDGGGRGTESEWRQGQGERNQQG